MTPVFAADNPPQSTQTPANPQAANETAEKIKHITKVNEHLHKGEKKEAIEVLKLGEVDVTMEAELIPVKFAKQHIDDAAKLIGEGKYYEANLALKSVEDAIVVETFAIDAIPNPAEAEPRTRSKTLLVVVVIVAFAWIVDYNNDNELQ